MSTRRLSTGSARWVAPTSRDDMSRSPDSDFVVPVARRVRGRPCVKTLPARGGTETESISRARSLPSFRLRAENMAIPVSNGQLDRVEVL
jgi:hypothetical protein